MRSALLKFVMLFSVAISTGCRSLYQPESNSEPESQVFNGDEEVEIDYPAELENLPPIAGPIVEEVPKNWPARARPHFDWPVDEARMTRGFMPSPRRGRRPHLGIDLAAGKGTPILAAHDGTVIFVGKSFRGFGKMIMIEDSQGWATIYAHLSTVYVREGARVRQGDEIAGMGRTGRATGVHLHFEIRTAQGPHDPLSYLPQVTVTKNTRSYFRR